MSQSTRPPPRPPRGSAANIAARRAQVAALHPTLTLVEIAARLNMKRKMVADDCRALGLRKSKGQRAAALRAGLLRSGRPVWNDALREVLALMYPCMSNPKLAEFLGFTERAVAGQARAMKLRKEPKPKAAKPQNQHDRAISRRDDVKQHYATMTQQQLADKHNVVVTTIENDLRGLKLRKTLTNRGAAIKAGLLLRAQAKAASTVVKAAPLLQDRLMSPLQLEKHIEAREKLRIRYTPETMPWKARIMFAPMSGIPDLSYRGQRA